MVSPCVGRVSDLAGRGSVPVTGARQRFQVVSLARQTHSRSLVAGHRRQAKSIFRAAGQIPTGQRTRGTLQVVSGKVQKLTAVELETALAERQVPLIIDFYATWCGPCLLLAKELEQVAEELGSTVRIVKVDTDEYPELSTQLQIQGLPTMVFVGMDKTKPALRTEGLLPASVIKEIVEKELS